MKNKFINILMLVVIICVIPITSFAGTAIDDVVSDGDSFLDHASSPDTVINITELSDFSGDVYNLILSIGMVVAVVVGSILGIKFMISSVDEKAKIKETLIVYGIGCAVLFGAFTIWKIVMAILGNV